ncbi:hypothetical protein C4F49_05320 [Sphingobacterium sp. KB22]|uniref:Uncharacterized protein n=2 Tax=Sphingobacterium hungaricum TaxID=2082723 RepID=A0A928UUR4_9SPHI|nr:hypothetical protein [Sphingobacterium hungaricum]
MNSLAPIRYQDFVLENLACSMLKLSPASTSKQAISCRIGSDYSLRYLAFGSFAFARSELSQFEQNKSIATKGQHVQ